MIALGRAVGSIFDRYVTPALLGTALAIIVTGMTG